MKLTKIQASLHISLIVIVALVFCGCSSFGSGRYAIGKLGSSSAIPSAFFKDEFSTEDFPKGKSVQYQIDKIALRIKEIMENVNESTDRKYRRQGFMAALLLSQYSIILASGPDVGPQQERLDKIVRKNYTADDYIDLAISWANLRRAAMKSGMLVPPSDCPAANLLIKK